MSMIDCSSCGMTIINPEARFCGRCGAQIAPASVTLTPQTVQHLAGRSGEYYARTFARMFPAGAISFKAGWNWAAALVPFWMIYRRLFLEFAVCCLLTLAVSAAVPGLGLAVFVAQGLFGDALYFKALERRASRATPADRAAHQLG